MQAEEEGANQAASIRLAAANYNFRLVGTEKQNDRPCYVLDAEPKTKNKYLFRGRVWIDAEDAAVAHIDAHPAQNPSFWTTNVHFVHRYGENRTVLAGSVERLEDRSPGLRNNRFENRLLRLLDPVGVAMQNEQRIDAQDNELIQIVDAAVAQAARRSGSWLVCQVGCTQCCIGPFPINQLDARRLRRGLAELAVRDAERAERVKERARQSVARMRPDFPGDPISGLLSETEEDEERFSNFADDEPCPALDAETGACDLYAARPVTCRTFGRQLVSVLTPWVFANCATRAPATQRSPPVKLKLNAATWKPNRWKSCVVKRSSPSAWLQNRLMVQHRGFTGEF